MKKTIALAGACLALGFGFGTASAGGKASPELQRAIANLEMGLNDMNGVKPQDAHIKKALDHTRKAIEELREAAGMGHAGHKHD